jgi:hypothetical protein
LDIKYSMESAGVRDAGKKTEFAGEQVMDNAGGSIRRTCCPSHSSDRHNGITRRGFLKGVGGAGVLGSALTGWSWASLAAVEDKPSGRQRRAIIVSPILLYETPQRKHQTSWRNWGGIQTENDAKKEVARIEKELKSLAARADFPVRFADVARVRNVGELTRVSEAGKADVFIVYAAGGWMDTLDAIAKSGKPVIVFCRHKSGPVYLWYEIISPRYLRRHTDTLAVKNFDEGDVVIDSQDELLWRLRALCGLLNTMGTRVVAIGGPDAWSQPKGVVPELVKTKWQFDMPTYSYDDLGNLIKEARADSAAVGRAAERAKAYLNQSGCKLQTDRKFVENAFLLEDVLRRVMDKTDCQAITINGCMGTIMPLAETSACLTLSLLNDAGYLAFCESDFVVIPSGVLLANISGKPVFLNDPTYPHDGVITLAHCTAPRKMDGKKLEPALILTHFESDYGAAPKVEMRKGQVVTNIAPDFQAKRWVGFIGKIEDVPFLDICRSQIDVRFACDSRLLAERMPGFHWMLCYGDYMKETGYALKKVGIQWEDLTTKPA